MRFWDSSALVPLLVDEDTSTPLEALFQDEQGVAVWWAADALQLAAAFVTAEGRPESLEILCLDERLALASEREGFQVIDRPALLGEGKGEAG